MASENIPSFEEYSLAQGAPNGDAFCAMEKEYCRLYPNSEKARMAQAWKEWARIYKIVNKKTITLAWGTKVTTGRIVKVRRSDRLKE